MTIKDFIMKAISASQIKQNRTLLQDALRGDLLITKRDKPFVLVGELGIIKK
jgi:PHD/YefM family antitoxin component YafN of YafNO toxin-antitoxin module